MLDSRLKAAVGAAASAGLLAALIAGGSASSAGAQTVPNCTPANNLEAIIDDSGSMSGTDPRRFRADLVNILATFNPEKTMGAVQFGSDATPLFAPAQIGPNLGAIRGSLNLIQADDGGTDYNDGFTLANSQNPNANARIFLSDGSPTGTPNPNLWRTPLIRAYVVGFGTVDPAILTQIAAETGGAGNLPFNITNASQLRTVAMIINARINCESDPAQAHKLFKSKGQVKGFGFRPSGSTAELVISWSGNARFKVFGFAQGKRGLKPNTFRGPSFIGASLSSLRGGKVTFKVKAKGLKGKTTVDSAIIP
jgi:hypothetical protein